MYKAKKTKKCKKITKSDIKFQNVKKKKNATYKREIATLLTFSTKKHKMLQSFYPR